MTGARRDRGNVSVMFFFGAMLLFAMIMAIAATGQKLIQREVLQDSADAAALAGAVVRAKALNFIAFCNLVSAALASLFVILKGVAFGLQLFLPIAASLCSSHHYDYCAYIPHAEQVQQRYAMASERMQQMMSTLASGERTVAQIAPAMALAEAYRAGTDGAFERNYGSGLAVEAVPGGPEALPVTDGNAGEWWQKAQDPYGRVHGYAMQYLHLTLGFSTPGNHAYQLASAGVDELNSPGTLPGDALPLALAGGWHDRRFFRTKSSLGDTDARWRRKIVGVAAQVKSSDGRNATMGSAQAEFFAFNGHEDLWHVDWRARLSLSTPFVPVPDELRQFWVH